MREDTLILQEIHAARQDPRAADSFIEKYLPFIRAEAAKFTGSRQDEDAVSIAMFAFYEALMSYQSSRGVFLRLAAKAIKNRLIDAYRKEQRHKDVISYHQDEGDESPMLERIAAGDPIQDLTHREAARTELAHFAAQLHAFGLSLADVAGCCPRQERTLTACLTVLEYARAHPLIFDQLLQTKKLPVTELAQHTRVERKTIERHRKYLIAILLAYTNGFEIIRGHLYQLNRKEAACE